MKRLPFQIWFVLCTLIIVLVGCGDRGPADIEADAERSVAKLKPLLREVEQIEKRLDAQDVQTKCDRQAMKSLREKLASLDGSKPAPQPMPTPAPSPGPSPTPPSPPAPSPAPAPTPQPTRFGIRDDVSAWARSINRPADLHYFIKAAESLADELRDGKISGFTRYDLGLKVKAAIGRHNVGIPKDVLTAFAPFFTQLNVKLNTIYAAEQLTTAKDWEAFFREAIEGLKAAQ